MPRPDNQNLKPVSHASEPSGSLKAKKLKQNEEEDAKLAATAAKYFKTQTLNTGNSLTSIPEPLPLVLTSDNNGTSNYEDHNYLNFSCFSTYIKTGIILSVT